MELEIYGSETNSYKNIENKLSNNMICVCKGIRTCKICETKKSEILKNKHLEDNIQVINLSEEIIQSTKHFNFENQYKEDNIENKINQIEIKEYFFNQSFNLKFDGLYVISNLFTNEEIENMLSEMNKKEWVESQSGRRKQDFGVKVNYKKKKIKSDYETIVFPSYKNFIEKRVENLYNISNLEVLKNYKLHEIGNLHYNEQRGSHIEAHIDDGWIWGNRILGVNLLSDTVMTFSKEVELEKNSQIIKIEKLDKELSVNTINTNTIKSQFKIELNFSILKNQVYIFSNTSRYDWKHEVKAQNIKSERIVITCREFVPEVLESLKTK